MNIGELSTSSISNIVSKIVVDEEMSFLRASLKDAASRAGSGPELQAISNEMIQELIRCSGGTAFVGQIGICRRQTSAFI